MHNDSTLLRGVERIGRLARDGRISLLLVTGYIFPIDSVERHSRQLQSLLNVNSVLLNTQ